MKKKILLASIMSLLAVLITINIKAATYETYTNLKVPNHKVAVGKILNKYDTSEQVVRYNAGLFARAIEARVAAADYLGTPCQTIYRHLNKNQSNEYGGYLDSTCGKYARSNGLALLSMRTENSYNYDTDFNGWWTTTKSNCNILGC